MPSSIPPQDPFIGSRPAITPTDMAATQRKIKNVSTKITLLFPTSGSWPLSRTVVGLTAGRPREMRKATGS